MKKNVVPHNIMRPNPIQSSRPLYISALLPLSNGPTLSIFLSHSIPPFPGGGFALIWCLGVTDQGDGSSREIRRFILRTSSQVKLFAPVVVGAESLVSGAVHLKLTSF
jgi:hypothetical protein